MLVIQVANVLINAVLFLDLYLIMRNPFYPRSQREKRYYFWICLFIVIHLSITAYQVEHNTYGKFLTSFVKGNLFLPYHRHLVEAIFAATLCLALGILFRLRFQGKSSNLKRKILSRHILYLLLFFLEFVYTELEMYS